MAYIGDYSRQGNAARVRVGRGGKEREGGALGCGGMKCPVFHMLRQCISDSRTSV